ncbi:MAG: septum formation initiator family protein [Bacteroidaceae bacterium]|nr:septum formation initiator family protein [Bacteroidaceae bacterium]
MTLINKIGSFILHNKYWIVIVIGVLVVGFTGDNSILQHLEYQNEIDNLENEISDYNKIYDESQHTIKMIQTDPHAITKIAREKYLMKADDEDIFVFSTDHKHEGIN